MLTNQNNIETLRAAVAGYQMQHGEYPHFILMTADIARSIFHEVEQNRAKYGDLVKVGGDLQPMKFNFGPDGGIEIGQIVGMMRVELVADPTTSKAMRSILNG